jgi:hypothetical protein
MIRQGIKCTLPFQRWGKTKGPEYLAIPLLGIQVKECKSGYNRDTSTSMMIAALFTIAKLWNQLRCSSTDQRKCGI